MVRILSPFQREILKEVGRSNLSRYFIWSGGTALSYRYLQHRKSYDLDFLSQELLPDKYLLAQIKKIAKNLKIQKIEEQKRLNRHEFWLGRDKETLKLEFVFYPFPNIKKPVILKEFNIKIDSIEDILTNKAHAIYDRSEPKDVFDLYCILQKRKIDFLLIFKWVKKKFVEIDPVLWGSETLKGVEKLNEIKPLILKKKLYNLNKIKKFFENQAHQYLRKKMPKT